MAELVIQIEEEYDEAQLNKSLTILGELIINEIRKKIRAMDLIKSGAFLQQWVSSVRGNKLIIENLNDFALYLEYGTYGYWDSYGEDSFPTLPHPKKKTLNTKMKKLFPSGIQPFAPVRRVVYDANIMTRLVKIAFGT